MQRLQEAAAPVRMCSTYSERLSRKLENNEERNFVSIIVMDGVERVLEVTAEKDDFLLRLKDYKVFKNNVGRDLSEQDILLEAMTA